LCNILQIALPVWKYTPVGPPVPIVKNSADFAIEVSELVTANITRKAEIIDVIFFIFSLLFNLIETLNYVKVRRSKKKFIIF
jgi:hypothetical protein